MGQPVRRASEEDELRAVFDDWAQDRDYPRLSELEYWEVLMRCPGMNAGGLRILDVGCGIGYVASIVKRLDHHVIGLDVSPLSVHRAQEAGHLNESIVGSYSKLDVPDQSVDVVLYFNVLMYVDHIDVALSEAHRVLKKGGRIIVLDYHSANPYVWFNNFRPRWLGKLIEGHVQAKRHAVNETVIRKMSGNLFTWDRPQYYNMFSIHPNITVHLIHRVARAFFALVHRITRKPWTYNYVQFVGVKMTEAQG